VRYAHVVYVMGNHEAYGSSIAAVRRTLEAMDGRLPGLHYLENSTCEIEGQRFAGSTLWVPRLPGIELLEPMLNDFWLISDAPGAIYDENARSVQWLGEVVRESDVIVTHHLPSPRSIHPRHTDSPINCFFVCDVEPLIAERQPRLWIHGHTHESMDYAVGRTRVLCNPYGYEEVEPNEQYSPALRITL
jgi:hypothetical protein